MKINAANKDCLFAIQKKEKTSETVFVQINSQLNQHLFAQKLFMKHMHKFGEMYIANKRCLKLRELGMFFTVHRMSLRKSVIRIMSKKVSRGKYGEKVFTLVTLCILF